MNNNNFVLYLHIAPNGKKYFGITGQTPKQRWSNGNGYKGQDFYEAIEEFGWQNIEHYVLADDLTILEARMFEVMTIAIYNTRNPLYGYNDSPGGGIHSEETRKKISEATKGEKNPMYGKTHTEETKQKIREANTGKVFTEEHKRKISKATKGYAHHSSKTVMCITTGYCFGSTVEAGKHYKIVDSNIRRCCYGELHSAGKLNGEKLVWKYVSDLPKPQLAESDKEHLRYILNKYSA